MASGNTITQALADSLPTAVASARQVREQVGVMTKSVDLVTLGRNTGLSWREISLEKLSSQAITESTELDNPQQLQDTLFTVTPTVVGIQTLITDRVAERISSRVVGRMGGLAQNAMERKKDEDGLVAMDGATNQLNSSTAVLRSSYIRAARARITSNTTEPAPMGAPIVGIFHGFQIKDLEDELLDLATGVLDGQVQTGLTQDVYQNGFRGTVGGVVIKEDGNLTIDSTPDAKGGVFAKPALVLVQGRSPRSEVRREPHIGGGATSVFFYDEYAYGERSSGNWLYEVISDATTPTS